MTPLTHSAEIEGESQSVRVMSRLWSRGMETQWAGHICLRALHLGADHVSHIVLTCPDLTVWPQTAHFILLTLNYSFPTSLLPPSNINMCQIWWGSLCGLTFSTYMPEGREKLGEQLLERVMVMGFFTSLQVWRGCWWNWRAGRYTQVPGRSFHNNDFSSTSVCVFSFDCTETACTCIPLTKAR